MNFSSSMYGSSPRARGTAGDARESDPPLRFIPAGAGNSITSRRINPWDSVHPRGRGEQGFTGHQNKDWRGSSPRARGTACKNGRWPLGVRFIPAGAGNSRCSSLSMESSSVHPRGRGEQATSVSSHPAISGSSPRARGTDLLHGGGADHARFIPAGAGNRHHWIPG